MCRAGVGALVNGLMALSIPKDRRANINRGLQAGEFLVSVTGNAEEVAAAREILQNSGEIELETHVAAEAAWSGGEGSEGRRKKHSSS